MNYTNDTLHTAACLWEAALDAMAGASSGNEPEGGFGTSLRNRCARWGTASLRQEIVELAPRCDAAWESLSEDEQDNAGAFDWEFAPKWLEENFFRIAWEGK